MRGRKSHFLSDDLVQMMRDDLYALIELKAQRPMSEFPESCANEINSTIDFAIGNAIASITRQREDAGKLAPPEKLAKKISAVTYHAMKQLDGDTSLVTPEKEKAFYLELCSAMKLSRQQICDDYAKRRAEYADTAATPNICHADRVTRERAFAAQDRAASASQATPSSGRRAGPAVSR